MTHHGQILPLIVCFRPSIPGEDPSKFELGTHSTLLAIRGLMMAATQQAGPAAEAAGRVEPCGRCLDSRQVRIAQPATH